MPDRSLRPLAYAGAVAVVSTALLVVAVGAGWLGADVERGANFCEAARDGWVKQPANSFSNLGFVVAGLLIAWHAGRTTLNGLATPYACIVVVLGPASAAMHATQSELGGELDLLSMYLVASFAAAYALMRWYRRDRTFFWQLNLLFVAACELIGLLGDDVPVVQQSGNVAFAALLLTAVVFEIRLWRRADPARTDLRWGAAALGVPAGRVRDLERHQVAVVRPALAAPGPRRLAPAGRGGGVPAVPPLGERAGRLVTSRIFGR